MMIPVPYFLSLLALLAVTLTFARRRLVIVKIRGVSMVPSYRPGDRVLIRTTRRVRRGQVVVIEPIGPDRRWNTEPLPEPASAAWIIKRIVAMPGDPVPEELAGLVEDTSVPEGNLVVFGDGEHSADSRTWGYVPVGRVLGVVLKDLEKAA